MAQREELLNISASTIIGSKYKLCSKTDATGTIVPLGEGGSGIVYLAEQEFVENIKVKRAIKFFLYRHDLQKLLNLNISLENFKDEIINITSFNHENIIKVIDGGIYEVNDLKVPYIVTDYVEGLTLEDLLNNESKIEEFFADKEKLLLLFLQILDGVKYLHRKNFYHCDIAPKNIFLKIEGKEIYAIIGDLGVGKTFNKNILDDYKSSQFHIIGTKSFMPDNVVVHKENYVNAAVFKELQPNWDIHSIKQTFKICLNKIFNIENKPNVKHSWANALLAILEDKFFKSVNHLYYDIERLQPIHRTTAGLLELSETDGTWKKLIPIKPVLLTHRIDKIIEHPMMLRLKKVPQLLMGSTVFPGANHTRYEHALGTYENMRLVLIQLLKKHNFLKMLDRRTLESALLAALLANITRFPFSFAIHEIKNTDKLKFRLLSQSNLLDKFLNFKDSEHDVDISLQEVIDEYFNDVDIEVVKELICGGKAGFSNKEIQLVYSLINSTIDVRVLDFLRRDPFHLGQNSGASFDFDNLVDFLDIHNNRIAIQSRGVSYVEQVVSMRYWMYKNIYWNEPNRAYTSILKQILGELESESFENHLIDNMIFSDPGNMLNFLKSKSHEKPHINDLIDLVSSNRLRKFKRLFIINKSEEDAVLANVCGNLSKKSFSEIEELRKALELELAPVFKFENDKINIIIDIPIDSNRKMGDDINVRKYDGSSVRITEVSGIIKGINDYFDSHLQWLRIFIHPIYKDLIKQQKIQKEANSIIKEFLINRLA